MAETTSPDAPAPTINAIITTFPGLPSLYNFTVPASSTLHDLFHALLSRLPTSLDATPLRLSATSGVPHSPSTPLALLTTTPFLTLRLTTPLQGGKGGFGSQLRAAGGRMSSRKKRGQQENNDSCRNLDGRRMRTVKEAKALAAYLEIKPEMERKEREARKERWRKVVEVAERREEAGGVAGGRGRFDDVEWLEETEEERVRTREAVERVMADVASGGGIGGGEGSSGSGSDGEEDEGGEGLKVKEMRFAGWDEEEDDDMSDVAEGDESEAEESRGKGKLAA